MARGSQAKQEIIEKILETFEGSFVNDKEVRIPVLENGEVIQIKCTFTAAKVNVEAGSAAAVPSVSRSANSASGFVEITEEEKQQVGELMKKLNL